MSVDKQKYRELKLFVVLAALFAVFYFMPMKEGWFSGAVLSGLGLLNEYAREHVLSCLLPAFFIAGAIAVFIKKEKVMKFLGHEAKKYVSYGVASVSGVILAVCSCTILPLFAGIRKRGAGLGPAVTFLFAGPAINIAAMFLTVSVLGLNIGLARIFAAILLAFLVGISMALIFREKVEKGNLLVMETEESKVSGRVLVLFFALLIGMLVVNGLQIDAFAKYFVIGIFTAGVVGIALVKFKDHITQKWLGETWRFVKMLLPLLFIGVFIAGFIMPLLPQSTIEGIVGSNSIAGNIAAAVFGTFMYFSTLTEIPILQALMAKGMHQGPALALLLAGPSLSLPNMLVIRKVLGNSKTLVYILLVIFYSTIAGLVFGGMI